jgi:hypothetical protein
MAYLHTYWNSGTDGFAPGPRRASTLAGVYKAWGQLEKEEVHASLLHPRRVLVLTCLAVNGPMRTVELVREFKSMASIVPVLRGLKMGYLVDSTPVRPIRVRDCGRCAREWAITETGRWALWRLAWLTRSSFVPAQLPWNIETEVPDDPIAAVRAHVRQEFLLPGSYVALSYLMRFGVCARQDIVRAMNVPHDCVRDRMRRWERLGWVETAPVYVVGYLGRISLCRRMTAAGESAVMCHVDALRKIGLSCGWTPTPSAVQYGPGYSQYHYEEEFLDMGWSL